jgi:Holliday junction DNA helicase RuvB
MGRRPSSFNDFVGQTETIGQLRRLAAGAMQRKEPFPHTLIIGPSGVGKTKLARALATEYRTKCHEAESDIRPADLARKFLRLRYGDFLFIDEVHGLSIACQEMLYRVMDDLLVPNGDCEGAPSDGSDTEGTAVEACTVILATDQPGSLKRALRRRLGHEVQLSFYPASELKEIVEKICSEWSILVSPHAARMIAEISRGVPGTAKHHLQMLRLRHPDAESSQLGIPEVREYTNAYGIDESGLDQRDRQYLRFLHEVDQASLESVALKLGIDEAEVRRSIEPFLVRLELARIATGGRRLTEKGRSLVEALAPGSLK